MTKLDCNEFWLALGGKAAPEINQITRYEAVEDEDSFSRQIDKNVDVYQVHNSKSRYFHRFSYSPKASVGSSKSTVDKIVPLGQAKKFLTVSSAIL